MTAAGSPGIRPAEGSRRRPLPGIGSNRITLLSQRGRTSPTCRPPGSDVSPTGELRTSRGLIPESQLSVAGHQQDAGRRSAGACTVGPGCARSELGVGVTAEMRSGMSSVYQGHASPDEVAVIGAGMVGLSTAWFLQEAGVRVTVYERDHVGAGASWGNAGWLTPALTAPLPEPAVLRYGLRAVLSPRSPVYLPIRADRDLLRFLAKFVKHSTARQWRRGMAAYVPLNERALEAFDALAAGGVTASTKKAGTFLACFARERDARGLLTELKQIAAAGQDVNYRPVSGRRARVLEPALTSRVGAAVEIRGQRYLHPPDFIRSLAEAVRARGGRIIEDADVTALEHGSGEVRVVRRSGEKDTARRGRGRHRRRPGRAHRESRGAAAGAGRTGLQLQRRGRADACRTALLPAAAGGLHALGRPAARGRDDGVPPSR